MAAGWVGRIGAVLAVAAMALAMACSPGEGGDPRATTTSPETPRPGGTLRIALVAPDTLDPARARSVDELFLADQLFDTLTHLDPDTLEPVAGLADSWGASPDQMVWQFSLRDGTRFADGSPLTAADVKFTLERVARKGGGSTVADLLEPVRGFKAVNVDASTADLAGVTVDGSTVRIQLDQPLADLPALLANPAFGVVPRLAVDAEGEAYANRPLGSGPFRLAAVGDNRLELVTAEGGESYVEGIEVLLEPNRASAYRAFTDQRLDWAPVPPEQAEAAASRHGTAGFRPYVAELFYGFNLKHPHFGDARMREAVARAVDRASIADAVYGGTVEPIESVVVPGFPGAQRDACERCGHDPEVARVLVGQLYPDGNVPEIALDFDEDPTQAAVAKVIESNLEAVGIPVALRPKPLAEYQSFAVSGEQQLFRLGWVPPYASPDAYLAPLFVTGFPSNLTGLASPAVDEAVRAARSEPERGARLARYQAAERLIMAELPIVPIARFRLLTVVSERVRNLELTMMGTFDASRVWLARS